VTTDVAEASTGSEWRHLSVEVADGAIVGVDIDGRRLCVARVDGTVFAVDTRCSHAAADLHDGELEGFEVECPWHGARFDIRTGEVVLGPARRPVRTYPVRMSGDGVEVSLTGP
jgi:nitrite reductase/ring-hydroxylating ferredoxin subunit